MKIKKDQILESIRALNKKQLNEDVEKDLGNTKVEITATLDPADKARIEEHEEAIKAHDERIEDAYKSKEVKELLDETASEESRYNHFDCVDRKDLAKRINEAKEKGLDFSIARSNKEGFRYDLAVLKEAYLKKDAGDPAKNAEFFNTATHVGSEPTAPVCEELHDKIYAVIEAGRDGYSPKQVVDYTMTVEELTEYLNNEFEPQTPIILSFDHGYTYGAINGGVIHDITVDDTTIDECDNRKLDESVNEELKVYTSKLTNFHPSARAKDLWDEIVEADKLEDLEYGLETIYPDGISDVALDDMLCHDEDFIRDLISLDTAETEDDDILPLDDDVEIESDEDIEPVEFDDIHKEAAEEIKDTTADEEPHTEKDSDEKPAEDNKDDAEEETAENDDLDIDSLGENFVNKNFKPNSLTENVESTAEKQIAEAVASSEDSEEDVVAVDDSMVESLMGFQKVEDKKGE